MSRYDGLIIPRSYNEYINKTDPVAMSQALQLNNVLAQEVAAGNNKAVTSNAVNGAIATLVNYNISTATSLDNAIPTESQKYKKCRFRGSVNGIDGIWVIETYSTQHDSNNNLYLYTQFAYQLKADNIIGSKFIRQGYSNDKGNANTWIDWEKITTSSDLSNYAPKEKKQDGTKTRTFTLESGVYLLSALRKGYNTNNNHCEIIFFNGYSTEETVLKQGTNLTTSITIDSTSQATLNITLDTTWNPCSLVKIN